MTFRSFAVLVFAGGVVTLVSALGLIGEAPGAPRESRHLRALKERRASPGAVTPWTMARFEALPHGRPLAAYAAYESQGISLEGWVQRTMLAGDGDLHLELAVIPRGPASRDTAYVTAEIGPRWRHGGWTHEALAPVFRQNAGAAMAWDSGPAKVRISGWLMYDFQYDQPPSAWALENGAPRVTGWEIHPVTRIERWSEALAGWVEVPR